MKDEGWFCDINKGVSTTRISTNCNYGEFDVLLNLHLGLTLVYDQLDQEKKELEM